MDKEVAKINKAVVGMANNFHLGVLEEDDTEEPREVVPELLTKEELLELEQKCVAEKEARGKLQGSRRTPRKLTEKGLAEAHTNLTLFLKTFENMDPVTRIFSLMQKNVCDA